MSDRVWVARGDARRFGSPSGAEKEQVRAHGTTGVAPNDSQGLKGPSPQFDIAVPAPLVQMRRPLPTAGTRHILFPRLPDRNQPNA